MKEAFNKLCSPAKLYFAIAVIMSIIELFNGIGIFSISIKLIFAFIWTFILGWVCKKGYKSISWFLVALPYIIILLEMFGIYRATIEGFGKYFPSFNETAKRIAKKRDACYANCDIEVKKREEELRNMSGTTGSYSRDEMQKKGDEIRKLKMDCAKNCDTSY